MFNDIERKQKLEKLAGQFNTELEQLKAEQSALNLERRDLESSISELAKLRNEVEKCIFDFERKWEDIGNRYSDLLSLLGGLRKIEANTAGLKVHGFEISKEDLDFLRQFLKFKKETTDNFKKVKEKIEIQKVETKELKEELSSK